MTPPRSITDAKVGRPALSLDTAPSAIDIFGTAGPRDWSTRPPRVVESSPTRKPRQSVAVDRTYRPVVVRLADVAPEEIEWLWPGRLACGKITLLVGDPGLGKSWFTLDCAARLSVGSAWPDGGRAAVAATLMLSAEDGLADTIRPRLDVLGADVRRIHSLQILKAGDAERGVGLGDVDALETAIRETRARLVVIDPISAFLGRVDAHRDAEVRGLLAPLQGLAERSGVAVLAVMHLSKGQKSAIYRPNGSIAFVAAARVVLAMAIDKEDEARRIVASLKGNLSVAPPALAFTLESGRLIWDDKAVQDCDVEQLLSGPSTSQADRDARSDAEQLLRELLASASWPMEATAALPAAESAGIPKRTFQRAAKQLGVRFARRGFGRDGQWIWHRPTSGGIGDTVPSDKAVAPMASMASKKGDIHAIHAIGAIDDNNFGGTAGDAPLEPWPSSWDE